MELSLLEFAGIMRTVLNNVTVSFGLNMSAVSACDF
jgi:hypothetical protein